jgi:hypothetical protein
MSNPSLSGIVADLICDGHLQGDLIWRADFTSKDLKELVRFNKILISLFRISGSVRNCNSNQFEKTFNLGINCAPIARILLLCGVPPGQKVLIPFDIPLWIKKDKECFRTFCKRCFSCEGSTMHEKNRRIPQVRLGMWKNEKIKEEGLKFLGSISEGMKEYFDIDSKITFPKSRCIRKDSIVTTEVRLYIFGNSVFKFCDEIGFEGKKQQSLKALLPKIKVVKDL